MVKKALKNIGPNLPYGTIIEVNEERAREILLTGNFEEIEFNSSERQFKTIEKDN